MAGKNAAVHRSLTRDIRIIIMNIWCFGKNSFPLHKFFMRMRLMLLCTILLMSAVSAKAQDNSENVLANIKKGIASFYHDKFEGRKTATGDIFDNDKYTAACNTLKLNSYVKVTNLSNGEAVYVKINDRMAKTNTRLIDLASIAAKKLEFHKKGITKVKVEVVPAEEGRRAILAQNGIAETPTNEL